MPYNKIEHNRGHQRMELSQLWTSLQNWGYDSATQNCFEGYASALKGTQSISACIHYWGGCLSLSPEIIR